MEALKRIRANTVEKRLLTDKGTPELLRHLLRPRPPRPVRRRRPLRHVQGQATAVRGLHRERARRLLPVRVAARRGRPGRLSRAAERPTPDPRHPRRARAPGRPRGDDAGARAGTTPRSRARLGPGHARRAEGRAVPAHGHLQAARRAHGDAATWRAEALARGVTAVSAGNHAIAVAYAARVLGTTAKVVMPKTANPFRVARCRELGAEVELVDDVHAPSTRVKQIEAEEGRTFVHPFEGPLTALGTATLGLELVEQAPDVEAVIVPIGGRRAVRGRGGRGEAGAAGLPRLRRRAGGRGQHAPQLRRRLAAVDRRPCARSRTAWARPTPRPTASTLCRRYVDDAGAGGRRRPARARCCCCSPRPSSRWSRRARRPRPPCCGPLRERLAGTPRRPRRLRREHRRHDLRPTSRRRGREALECPPS